MALMAARFFGDPTAKLRVIGVTGTNGKTTTAHLAALILDAAGLRPALLGTVVNRIGGEETPVTLTTAESCDLQAMFAAMVRAGDLSCAMEASSHALALERVTGIEFAAVVFTNLTRDHLDFHSDIDDYFLAKRRLFLPDGRAPAARGRRRERRRRLRPAPRRRVPRAVRGRPLDVRRALHGRWTRSWSGAARGAAARRRQRPMRGPPPKTSIWVRKARRSRCACRASGSRAASRCVWRRTSTWPTGSPPRRPGSPSVCRSRPSCEGLESTAGVPGRFEAVRAGQPFTVLVDYAHTPDSLENALQAARGVSRGPPARASSAAAATATAASGR